MPHCSMRNTIYVKIKFCPDFPVNFVAMLRFVTFLFLLLSTTSFAQRNVADSAIGVTWLSPQYGFNLTGGDLAKRHGYFNAIGFTAGYKTPKNWFYGFDGNYLFGNDVRLTGLFDHLVDSKGNITDQNGDIADVLVYSRGFHANALIGKLFPVLSPNKNSGFMINLGVGYLLHKVRVETQNQVVPQLELEYKKGYDRLTAGLNTSEFIGYSYMANQGFVNFYGGVYFQQGYTYNKRSIFYDQPDTPVSKEMMLDLQYGLRVGWMIPIYKRKPKEYYFN